MEIRKIIIQAITTIIVLFLLPSVLGEVTNSNIGNCKDISSNIITVDDEEYDALFTSIQEAVDNSNSGDIIHVKGGKYQESIEIHKQLTIVALPDEKDDEQEVVIDSQYKDNCFTIYGQADGTTLDGFHLLKGGNKRFGDSAILVYASNATIRNTIIEKSAKFAITLFTEYCKGSKIYNNEIKDNKKGILVWGAVDCRIHDNSISSNDIQEGNCICISESDGNNQIIDNELLTANEGIHIQELFSPHDTCNTIKNNKIHDCNIGISTSSCHNDLIEKNIFKENKIGISSYSERNIIKNNNFSNNKEYGIFCSECSADNIIFNNKFIKNRKHAYDQGSNNWDNSKEKLGNYWDNYKGFGNYNIPPYSHKNIDRYPIFEDDDNSKSRNKKRNPEESDYKIDHFESCLIFGRYASKKTDSKYPIIIESDEKSIIVFGWALFLDSEGKSKLQFSSIKTNSIKLKRFIGACSERHIRGIGLKNVKVE